MTEDGELLRIRLLRLNIRHVRIDNMPDMRWAAFTIPVMEWTRIMRALFLYFNQYRETPLLI